MSETITVNHDTAFEIYKWFRFAAPRTSAEPRL